MQRRDFIKLTSATGMLLLVTPTGILQASSPKYTSTLEKLFADPPTVAKPGTMWFWMNGQVSKQGITLDLEAMHRVGVGAVFNFDAGTGIPKGPLEYLSPEWLETKKFAFAEAERLGIEFNMHNCPGWSSSGGPWITPALAMQQLTWSETTLKGGKRVRASVPKPFHKLDYYQDVAVVAFPTLAGEEPLAQLLSKVTSSNGAVDIEQLNTSDPNAVVVQPTDGEAWLLFEFKKDFPARCVSFTTAAVKAKAPTGAVNTILPEQQEQLVLEASEDGVTFHPVATLAASGSLEPTQVIRDFPATKDRYLRLKSSGARSFSQVRFSAAGKFNEWQKRTNLEYNGLGLEELAPAAGTAIDLNKVVDITRYMNENGELSWRAPAGNWTVLRLGYTPIGTTNRSAPDTGFGLECDKYRAEAVEFHFNKMMDILLPVIGSMAEKGMVGLEIDSWEVGMQNWTPGFEQAFEKRNAYDLTRYLPAMTGRVVGSADTTERFLWDLRRTQADMLADNYYGKFDELCNQHQIISYVEPYDRGPMEEMQIGSRADRVLGEFWNGLSSIFQNNLTMRRTSKLAASVAHINGQRVISTESFTGEPEAARWQAYPFGMKATGDKNFCLGINRIAIHRFAHQPHPTAVPGMTMGPWGIHFDRTNTWWEPGKAWLNYMARCQSLLQQGQFIADLAYFSGEDPGMYTTVNREDLHPSPPFGYDYDVINAETILKSARVENNRLVLPHGMNYGVLVLQEYERITLPFLRKVHEMVQQGLPLVGARPVGTPGLQNHSAQAEAEFNRLCEELWGKQEEAVVNRKVGKGHVYWGQQLTDVLQALQLQPDFEYSSRSGDAPITYIHRTTDEGDIYFISNLRRTPEEVVGIFRVSGKQPELWDAVTGKMISTPIYEESHGRTHVPVQLNPYGSMLVIFRGAAAEERVQAITRNNQVVLGTQPFPGVARELYKDVINNFTVLFWAKPEQNIMLRTDNFMERVEHPWTDFYAVYPASGSALYGPEHAVSGVALGRNGVAVWENTANLPVFVLAAPVAISGWSHIAIVYSEGVPSVYVNGQLVKTGEKKHTYVHPGIGKAYLQEGASYFNGDMTKPELLNEALPESRIKALAAKSPDTTAAWTKVVEPVGEKSAEFLFWQEGSYTALSSRNKSYKMSVAGLEPPKVLTGSWQVSFPPDRGAPASITLPRLMSLHKHAVDGVRYFAGTATYSHSFRVVASNLQNGKRLFLDLGQVEVIAEVKVNGRDMGILWTRPYMVDITDAVKPGTNQLEVKVTNQWPNRLIGDAQLPDVDAYMPGGGNSAFAPLVSGAIEKLPAWYQQGQPKPDDGRVTFTTWKHYTADTPLLESGLVGPVLIRTAMLKALRQV
ncbi:glycosyl hydrolase [Pontibacter sp. CAU 1760]